MKQLLFTGQIRIATHIIPMIIITMHHWSTVGPKQTMCMKICRQWIWQNRQNRHALIQSVCQKLKYEYVLSPVEIVGTNLAIVLLWHFTYGPVIKGRTHDICMCSLQIVELLWNKWSYETQDSIGTCDNAEAVSNELLGARCPLTPYNDTYKEHNHVITLTP